MSQTESNLGEIRYSVPEVFTSEDGETYWAFGHVDPVLFVLGVVVAESGWTNGEEAVCLLRGDPPRYTSDQPHRSEQDCRVTASDFLNRVDHRWLREDPENEEVMHPAKADEEGAMPFTVVNL